MTDFTIDDFLGGLIRLKQAVTGYRATSDAVMVAAAVRAKPAETVLDVGCGSGIVGLCIGARVPNLEITGIEMQPELAVLAHENADLNNQKLEIITGDISKKIPSLRGRLFHHVVTNPPFYTETPKRADIQVETAYKQVIPLKQWLDFCVRHMRAKGSFTIIHRTEALPEILSALQGRLGDITVYPIFSKDGQPAKRVIVTGKLGSSAPFRLHPGFIMHMQDNTRTELAERIMRRGEALVK